MNSVFSLASKAFTSLYNVFSSDKDLSQKLPKEMINEIFSRMDYATQWSFSLTSKNFRPLLGPFDPQLLQRECAESNYRTLLDWWIKHCNGSFNDVEMHRIGASKGNYFPDLTKDLSFYVNFFECWEDRDEILRLRYKTDKPNKPEPIPLISCLIHRITQCYRQGKIDEGIQLLEDNSQRIEEEWSEAEYLRQKWVNSDLVTSIPKKLFNFHTLTKKEFRDQICNVNQPSLGIPQEYLSKLIRTHFFPSDLTDFSFLVRLLHISSSSGPVVENTLFEILKDDIDKLPVAKLNYATLPLGILKILNFRPTNTINIPRNHPCIYDFEKFKWFHEQNLITKRKIWEILSNSSTELKLEDLEWLFDPQNSSEDLRQIYAKKALSSLDENSFNFFLMKNPSLFPPDFLSLLIPNFNCNYFYTLINFNINLTLIFKGVKFFKNNLKWGKENHIYTHDNLILYLNCRNPHLARTFLEITEMPISEHAREKIFKTN